MNPNQPGLRRPSPEGQPFQPPKEENIPVQPSEAPKPAQPAPPGARPQPPISEAEPIQAQPEAKQVEGAPVQAAEVPPLDPDQASAEIERLIATDPRTLDDLKRLANSLEQTTSRT